MADSSAPAAAAAANARPTQPDADLYKEKLAVAEKEHQAVMAELVCAVSRAHGWPWCPSRVTDCSAECHQGQDRSCNAQQEQGPAVTDAKAPPGIDCPDQRDS